MERENIETKAWVPLQGVEPESIYCEQPREQVMPSNERDPISFSTCETALVQTGLLTSSASITRLKGLLSVARTTSTSSVTELFLCQRELQPVYRQCTHNICCNKIAESNLYQLFQSTTQPYWCPTVHMRPVSMQEAPQPHIWPLSAQEVSVVWIILL